MVPFVVVGVDVPRSKRRIAREHLKVARDADTKNVAPHQRESVSRRRVVGVRLDSQREIRGPSLRRSAQRRNVELARLRRLCSRQHQRAVVDKRIARDERAVSKNASGQAAGKAVERLLKAQRVCDSWHDHECEQRK